MFESHRIRHHGEHSMHIRWVRVSIYWSWAGKTTRYDNLTTFTNNEQKDTEIKLQMMIS